MSPKKALPLWQNRNVLAPLVRPFYRPYPFHNIPHVQKTTNLGIAVAEQAIAHGIEIDTSVLPLAGYTHDAGNWFMPGRDHPFKTAEAFSANVAWRIGQALGMPKPKLELACDMIESSGPDKPCITPEAKALSQGDLMAGGLLDEPIIFLNGTYRLYKESKIIGGEPLAHPSRPQALATDFVRFGSVCHDKLGRLVSEDLSIGDYDRDDEGRSLFVMRAEYNLNLLTPRLMTDFLSKHMFEIVNYGSPAV